MHESQAKVSNESVFSYPVKCFSLQVFFICLNIQLWLQLNLSLAMMPIIPVSSYDIFVCLFVCVLGCFGPLCVRSPLDIIESGVLFHIWWLSKQSLVLHDSPPWKVALCLPYPTTPSPPRSQARGETINYETLYIMWVILLIVHHQLSYLREN